MISSRHASKITIALTAAAVALCVFAMIFYDQLFWITNDSDYGIKYASELFDTSEIIDVDIDIDAEKWQEMLGNAIREEYYECNVSVNGTLFQSVGIRCKGNTSLSSVANDPNNDRYSFKIEFDKYIGGQTCFGLDKLVLNNNYADTTNMKEALVYDMFRFLDADASLYNYAKISVNGEYWGVYLALEAVEESFMLRNYKTERGHLYKPDGMNMGKHARGGGSGGANLNYTDDDLESYSDIWNAEVTDSDKTDHARVVEALKKISKRENIERYIDLEQVLKYMAVHNFSVNEDSLSGSMAHNYYLYEANGKISIIPWDYNLSFGGMNAKDAGSVVNDAIDDEYSATDLFDFVLENDEYKARYHEYYNRLVDEYFDGGVFDETYSRIREQLDELVNKDPNAMYDYEKYTKGAETLYKTVLLRAESVSKQLAGTIPPSSAERREIGADLVDASEINLSDMGEFMGGGAQKGNRK